ncbi:hypothetical protein ZWY2020_047173 [Hordeum vulgare]|nr:hypothetical protein ZWY2020_047173 [Hordeum vulgare]
MEEEKRNPPNHEAQLLDHWSCPSPSPERPLICPAPLPAFSSSQTRRPFRITARLLDYSAPTHDGPSGSTAAQVTPRRHGQWGKCRGALSPAGGTMPRNQTRHPSRAPCATAACEFMRRCSPELATPDVASSQPGQSGRRTHRACTSGNLLVHAPRGEERRAGAAA